MSEVNVIPVVTCPDGRWRGDWNDGYAVILVDAEIRSGIYRAQLEVHYHDAYVDTLTVDLLSSHARAAFSMTLAARNGATPILWDKRLGDFYHHLHEAQRLRSAPVTRVKAVPLAPALPKKAILPTHLAAGAAPWLEAYISHSATWSPRGASHFHAGIGLWMLSTVAARRIGLELGHMVYPSLFIALIARSTLYAKTTTAKIGKHGLRHARLGLQALSAENFR